MDYFENLPLLYVNACMGSKRQRTSPKHHDTWFVKSSIISLVRPVPFLEKTRIGIARHSDDGELKETINPCRERS